MESNRLLRETWKVSLFSWKSVKHENSRSDENEGSIRNIFSETKWFASPAEVVGGRRAKEDDAARTDERQGIERSWHIPDLTLAPTAADRRGRELENDDEPKLCGADETDADGGNTWRSCQ